MSAGRYDNSESDGKRASDRRVPQETSDLLDWHSSIGVHSSSCEVVVVGIESVDWGLLLCIECSKWTERRYNEILDGSCVRELYSCER